MKYNNTKLNIRFKSGMFNKVFTKMYNGQTNEQTGKQEQLFYFSRQEGLKII